MSLHNRITALFAAGLNPMQVLVALSLETDGPCPKGRWAEAWGCSVRTIEGGLKAVREVGVVPAQDSSHDDRKIEHGTERGSAQDAAQGAALTDDDPLVQALRAEGIYPGAAVNLIREHGRERVERQLGYHAERKAAGWTFRLKGQPVAPGHYLRLAILGDWRPMWTKPAGLVEGEAHRARERAEAATMATALVAAAGPDADHQAIARAAVAVAAPPERVVTPAEPARLASRETVQGTLSRRARSRLAPVRLAAIQEALRVGLDPLQHGFDPAEVAAVSRGSVQTAAS
jgi:hypothetical protein